MDRRILLATAATVALFAICGSCSTGIVAVWYLTSWKPIAAEPVQIVAAPVPAIIEPVKKVDEPKPVAIAPPKLIEVALPQVDPALAIWNAKAAAFLDAARVAAVSVETAPMTRLAPFQKRKEAVLVAFTNMPETPPGKDASAKSLKAIWERVAEVEKGLMSINASMTYASRTSAKNFIARQQFLDHAEREGKETRALATTLLKQITSARAELK